MSVTLDQERRFLGLEDGQSDPESSGCVIIPVPFEQTSSYGQGSARGPRALLEASHQVELHDCGIGAAAHELAGGICTLAPLPVADCDGGEALAVRLERAAGEWIDRGKRVVTLGGEHTSVVGAIQAHAARYDDLTVLQLDAHADLRDTYLADRWNHACAMARVLDFHGRLVPVGIRSQTAEERDRADALRLPVFYAEQVPVADCELEDWARSVASATTSRVYLTIDCDVLDPSIMPATGTPEPGGLSWRQLDRLLSVLASDCEIVGFDLCELAPIDGLHHPDFTAAKLLQRTIAYMFGGY